jgi:hypothetical protein
MPSEAKPLFRADALRPKLVGFGLPAGIGEARTKLGGWVTMLANKQADKMKETELLADFITDVFLSLLGFTGPASGGQTYTLKREALVKVGGKQADAALGRFAIGGGEARFIAVVEGKGPRDVIYHIRGRCQIDGCRIVRCPPIRSDSPTSSRWANRACRVTLIGYESERSADAYPAH